MAITADVQRIAADLRRIVATEVDSHTRTLVQAWAKAWDQIVSEWEAASIELASLDYTPTLRQIARMTRARQALDAADRQILNLMGDLTTSATATAGRLAAETARLDAQQIAAQLPRTTTLAKTAVRFDLVSEDALAAIVERTTQQITSLTQPLADDAIGAMLRALTRGITEGLSPYEAARAMVRDAESGFNGGLTRAMTIARTEILDAYRGAARAQQDANADVLQGWVWLASLDANTCPSCIAKAGSIHPLTEAGPEDHQNGRCARMPYVKPWSDLGIAVDEPPSTLQDGATWFAAQPEAVQLQIMGPSRLAALQAGDITIDDLSTRIETPGWRPSYVATPVRKLAA